MWIMALWILVFYIFACYLNISSASTYLVSHEYTTVACENLQCPNILSALKKVSSGDKILISPGTYDGVNNTGFNSLRISSTATYNFQYVTLAGDGEPSSVIISGGLFNTRFLEIVDNSFALITNLTFANFRLPKITSYAESELALLGVNVVGGTFAVANATVAFKNINFYNNSALFGAAISATGSSIEVTNCEFTNNDAGYHGGGISVGQSDITVKDSRFYNNTATSVRQQLAASGGAIFSIGVSTNHTIIMGCTFINNTADHNGGAVSLEPGSNLPQVVTGSVSFKHCTFYNNAATGVGSCLSTTSCITSGGAVYVTSSNVTVFGCHFERNRAHTTSTIDLAEGGAIFSTNLLGSKGTSRSMTRIYHCTFRENSAWGYGGAIYFDKQRFQINKSSFDNNEVLTPDQLFSDTPAAGGAIFVSYSNSPANVITYTNFTGNAAVTGWGGSIYATETSAISLTRVIFLRNFAISSYTNAALGGAVMVTGQCSLNLDDCEFLSNAAVPLINNSPMTYSGSGGGIYAQSSSVSIKRSYFHRNYAFTGQFDGGSTGGGVVLEDCYPAIIDRTTFVQNAAIGFLGKSSYASSGTGGALYTKFSSADVNGSTFSQNWASAGGKQNSIGGGVAVYFDYSSVETSSHGVRFNRSTFGNNTAFGQICSQLQAGSGGAIGIVGANKPPLLIDNVTFAENYALGSPINRGISGVTANGGAVSASLNTNVTVFRSTFFHNTALYGTGDDFSSIAGEENEENFLEFRDVVFHTASSAEIINVESKLYTLANNLCEMVGTFSRETLSTFSLVTHNPRMSSIPHHRALSDGFKLVDDYGIHVSIPKRHSKNDAAYLHLFDKIVEVEANEILTSNIDSADRNIDEEGILTVLERHYQEVKKSSESDISPAGISSHTKIMEKMINFLKTRGEEIEKKTKLNSWKWSDVYPRDFSPMLDHIDRVRSKGGAAFDDEEARRRTTENNFPTNTQQVVSKFVNSLPDIIATRGRATFYNPTFKGDYHVFVGDYTSYVLTRQGSSDYSDKYFRSYMQFLGSIDVDNLTLTGVNADVYSDVIDAKDHDNLHLSKLNVFNSSIEFTSNIFIEDQSILLDSIFIGKPKGDFAGLLYKPNITFESDVVTGYSLPEIFGYERSLRPAIHEFDDHHRNTTNQSLSSSQHYRGCNVFIEGQMVIDSPYHAVDVYVGTSPPNILDKYFNFFSDSQIILEKNATITIRKSGSLVLLTNTIVTTDDESSVALLNYGDVALLGTTVSLVYQTGDNPERLRQIAHSGSLGSKLTVLGNYFQALSGTISIYLNYTYQAQPVVFLANNRTFGGSIFVDFYGVDPYNPQSQFCPSLQIGSEPSSFTVVSFLNTNNVGLSKVKSPFFASKPAKVKSIQGITFDTKVENLFIPSLNQTVHNQVLQVQSISCENIFSYYAGVAASTGDSQYPCYICLQNSSCSLCQNPSTGQRTCAATNFCPANYAQTYTGDCCGGCGKDGTCTAKNPDFSAFTCDYDCSWFYSQASECKAFSTQGLVVVFIGCALFLGILGIYYMYRRSAQQKEQVLEELREGILRHTLTANNDYIQDMQQALILNDVFVKYDELKIESKVGEGSFGVVHKATFRGAQVAVKQMRSMFVEITDKEIEEFRKEAYMMSRLRHPNIVLVMGITLVEMEPVQPKSRTLNSVMDSDMPGNSDKDKDKKKPQKPQKTVCIITEFLEQGSLSDILYGSTRLPPEIFTYELILTIALQAARGMLYLHSHQPPICHRDLKSSNLVVDDHWVVKVTDFGMSRIVPERVQDEDKGVGEDDRESLGGGSIAEISELNAGSIMVTSSSIHSRSSGNTNGGQTLQTGISAMTGAPNLEMTSNLGTTAWCAPEVLTSSSRARYSIKVDVYSYGMVLWELYEKKRPFEEYSSRFDIMDAVKAGKRPTISDQCPPTYKALIKRCWQTEPSRRPTFNYIVRYLKDELARVKRSKTVVQSNGGASQFSNFPRPGSMSAYIRQSFSTAQQTGSNTSAQNEQPRPSLSLLSRFSMSANPNRDSVSHHSTSAVAAAIGNPLQSVVHGADLETGDLKDEDVGMSPVASVNNNPMSYLEERRQAELKGERPTVVRDGNNTGLGNTLPVHRESFKNLPENRTPLVAAVDRSLSYLTESPALSQTFRPHQKYGVPQNNTWRDKYVMQFSGWNSANPDSGLPPQSRAVPGASPNLSFSPALIPNPDMTRQGRGAPSGSPSRQMPPPTSLPRGFVPSAGPGSMPSSQAQSPVASSPIANATLSSSHNEVSQDDNDNTVFTMDDDHSTGK